MLHYARAMLGRQSGAAYNSLAVTLLGSQVDTTNVTDATVTATPAVGDLLVVFAEFGNADATGVSDNQGGTYTAIGTTHFWVRTASVSSAVSTTVTATQDGTATARDLLVFKVTGSTKFGSAAVKQSGTNSGAGASTPTVTLGAAPLTQDAIIGVVTNASNPAAITPRTGFTEVIDSGNATPTHGVEAMTRNSGETSTSQAWGGTSATTWQAAVLELDASV